MHKQNSRGMVIIETLETRRLCSASAATIDAAAATFLTAVHTERVDVNAFVADITSVVVLGTGGRQADLNHLATFRTDINTDIAQFKTDLAQIDADASNQTLVDADAAVMSSHLTADGTMLKTDRQIIAAGLANHPLIISGSSQLQADFSAAVIQWGVLKTDVVALQTDLV